MLKMFTTQLVGRLNDIHIKQLHVIEDAARLLSQALVGSGKVYIYGKDEMQAVTAEALYGQEKIPEIYPLLHHQRMNELHPADRVLLVTRTSDDAEVLSLANELKKENVPFVVISNGHEIDTLVQLADVHIDLKVTRSLVPTDEGERIGFPCSLVALYTYFCLYLTINEILSEYD